MKTLKETIENSIKVGGYIITREFEEKNNRFVNIVFNEHKNNLWKKIK